MAIRDLARTNLLLGTLHTDVVSLVKSYVCNIRICEAMLTL